MQAYWTLTRRELAAFFCSITGYVIISASAFLIGAGFIQMIVQLGSRSTEAPITELFYQTMWFWVIVLLATPIITMRLFALEKFSGTYETLMTTPVSDMAVVAAKFSSALIFYAVLWLPLFGCTFVLKHFSGDAPLNDPGALACTYLGILLMGCMFVSLGCFASALTRSQTTAAMIALLFAISLFLLSFLSEKVPGANWGEQVISCFALRDQMTDFVRGVADTRAIVLYISITFFFLFLTLRVIESRRWK
jgi:ABC-2 type transport system permease protein